MASGDFFDQDDPSDPRSGWGAPSDEVPRFLFGQDASMQLQSADPMAAARYQRERDRQWERELELRREIERDKRRTRQSRTAEGAGRSRASGGAAAPEGSGAGRGSGREAGKGSEPSRTRAGAPHPGRSRPVVRISSRVSPLFHPHRSDQASAPPSYEQPGYGRPDEDPAPTGRADEAQRATPDTPPVGRPPRRPPRETEAAPAPPPATAPERPPAQPRPAARPIPDPAAPTPTGERRPPPAPEPRSAVPPAPAPPSPAPPAPAPPSPAPPGAAPQAPAPQAPAPRVAAADPDAAPVRRRPEAAPAHRRPPPGPPAGSSTGRATAILAAGTFASRLTGFIRVLVVGYVLGVNVLSDAFNYANGVPNIIYDLLLGGILSATLIPVFVDHLQPRATEGRPEDPAAASRAMSAVLSAIALALVGVSALLWLLAPQVIDFYLLLTPKATGPAEKALATDLLRYFSPQVFFLGTTVATTALLNARRRFAAAALSPVLNNLVAIAALLATKVTADHVLTDNKLSPTASLEQFTRDHRAVLILGLGTTLGYAVQLAAQLPALHRLGLRLRPTLRLRHPAVRRVAALSTWLVGVVIANQASLALVMVLAGRVKGGVTAYQFSYQFFQLPYALIAVSVATAIMPDLAERYTRRQRTAFERQFVQGVRVTMALLLPVAVLYMVVAEPFITLAIHHGRVSGPGAHLVGTTLIYFAAGLPGFSAFFLLMRAFQAMQDARTMFFIYLAENALTVVAAVALSPVLGVPGLALAWVAPYTLASLYAVRRLRRRVGTLGGWLTVRALLRIFVSTAVAGGVALAAGLLFRGHDSDLFALGRLVVQGGGGLAVYFLVARSLGVRELQPASAAVRRIVRR